MSAKVRVVDKDKGWLAMLERAAEIKDARVKVGVLADDKQGGLHEVGADGKASELTVAEVAAVLHFGTLDGRIPPRPFLTSTFEEQREELTELGKKLIEGILKGKMDVDRALNIMGAKLAAEVKKKITAGAGMPPPNAPSTIERKGSERPLVDTGRLLGAITWAVAKKGEAE